MTKTAKKNNKKARLNASSNALRVVEQAIGEKKGRFNQLTRQVGEHLVASELGRRGYIAAPFAGNVPLFDLLAADASGYSIPIQVKAINEGSSWQYGADTFLEIDLVGKTQVLRGKKSLLNPNLICIYVLLHRDGQPDEFFIFRLHDLQKFTLKSCFKNGKSRIRIKNPKSMHCAVYPKDIQEFRDNWELITKTFDERRVLDAVKE